MTVLEHLSEALRLDRLERASSPVSMHIVNALATFGTAGQNEVRKANAARLSRQPVAKSQGEPRQWNPAEKPGKITGLPVSEVIESPLNPGKPQAPQSKPQPSQATTEKSAPVAPPSEKRSAQVAEISVSPDAETSAKMAEFQDLVNAKPSDIPNRPTKVLEMYGLDQIKTYLELSGVEIKEGASEREIAGLLIQTVNKK